MAVAGLYRRLLPSPAIDFTSPEGKGIFREALDDGNMEGFFKLIAHFQTQAEPAFCGLASLAVVLNSLAIDPGRTWKGPWRWFDESMLDCCEPLDKVKVQGISLAKVACLGECSGARVEAVRANQTSVEEFRQLVKDCCLSEDRHMIACYNRKLLKQTGSGHFSPIGGYHQGRDMALILDVARFKYPPHWVPLQLLWDAINTVDASTGKFRGFMIITKRLQPPALLLTRISCKVESWGVVSRFLCEDIGRVVQGASLKTAEEIYSAILDSFPGTVTGFVKWIAEVRRSYTEESQRLDDKAKLLNQLRNTQLYKQICGWLKNKNCAPCSLSCSSSLPHEIGSLLCVGGEEKCLCKTKLTTMEGGHQLFGAMNGLQVLVPTSSSSDSSIASCLLHPNPVDMFTLLLFAQPVETWSAVSNQEVRMELESVASIDRLPQLLQHEIQHLQRQLRVLHCNED